MSGSRLTVFTPTFYVDEAPVHRLRYSCAVHDVPLICYGQGRVYQPHGIVSHIVEFANELERHRDVEIAMLTDAFDSWLLAGEREIVNQFENIGSSIVIAGERDCWPVQSIRERFPKTRSPYRWLNAGGMIGDREYLIHACHRLMSAYGEGLGEMQGNPQGLWSMGYVDGIVDVKIDHECRIFQTMSGSAADDLLFTDGLNLPFVSNITTRSLPCVLHHNGRCGDDDAVERSYRQCYPDGESVPQRGEQR